MRRKCDFKHMRTANALIRAFAVRLQNQWKLIYVSMESKCPNETLNMCGIMWIRTFCACSKTRFTWRGPSEAYLFVAYPVCLWENTLGRCIHRCNNLNFVTSCLHLLYTIPTPSGRPPWLSRKRVWRWSGGRGFDPLQVRQHSFVETDHKMFSKVILFLSAESSRAVVSFWRRNVHKYWLTA